MDLSPVLKATKYAEFFYGDALANGSTVIDNVHSAVNTLSGYCEVYDLCVNVSKKISETSNREKLSPADRLFYRSDQTDSMPDFLRHGIVFSRKLSADVHFNHVKMKSRDSMLSVQKKVDLNLISFIFAYRLLLLEVLPPGTYGNCVFELSADRETDHNLSLFELFRKNWCNVSYRWRSVTLVSRIFNEDYRGIRFCRPNRRRPSALFY